jgi:hypothetical protein
MFIAFLWRLVRERGHSVFGVQSSDVQKVMTEIIRRYTTLLPLNMINSGPTHQQVFRGGTVIAWFDNTPGLHGLPKNARSYVVWGKKRRRMAAEELVRRLRDLGFDACIHEPLPDFPPGTFLMVKSDAFIDNAHAFRPHWVKMAFLEVMSKANKK